MRIKRFDVVELKDKNKATILEIEGNRFFAEIVDSSGVTLDKRFISDSDINKIIYTKVYER